MRARRVIVGVVVAVLGGAMANVAVTVWLALERPHDGFRRDVTGGRVTSGEPLEWDLRRRRFTGMERLYWEAVPPDVAAAVDASLVPRWSAVRHRPPDPRTVDRAELLIEVGFGWPWTAASYEYRRLGDAWTDPRSPVAGGFDLGNKSPSEAGGRLEVRAIPLRPAWVGLVGNTAVYAAAALLVAWLARVLPPILFVKRSRRRAGLCVTCGYDLRSGDSTVCPECGC